jgi:hypothetical protein
MLDVFSPACFLELWNEAIERKETYNQEYRIVWPV